MKKFLNLFSFRCTFLFIFFSATFIVNKSISEDVMFTFYYTDKVKIEWCIKRVKTFPWKIGWNFLEIASTALAWRTLNVSSAKYLTVHAFSFTLCNYYSFARNTLHDGDKNRNIVGNMPRDNTFSTSWNSRIVCAFQSRICIIACEGLNNVEMLLLNLRKTKILKKNIYIYI